MTIKEYYDMMARLDLKYEVTEKLIENDREEIHRIIGTGLAMIHNNFGKELDLHYAWFVPYILYLEYARDNAR